MPTSSTSKVDKGSDVTTKVPSSDKTAAIDSSADSSLTPGEKIEDFLNKKSTFSKNSAEFSN